MWSLCTREGGLCLSLSPARVCARETQTPCSRLHPQRRPPPAAPPAPPTPSAPALPRLSPSPSMLFPPIPPTPSGSPSTQALPFRWPQRTSPAIAPCPDPPTTFPHPKLPSPNNYNSGTKNPQFQTQAGKTAPAA